MPFKFRWPFNWPRRRRPDVGVDSPAVQPSGAAKAAVALAGPTGDEPVQLLHSELPVPPSPVGVRPAEAPPDVSWPDEPAAPDLGLELLSHLPTLSTPPTLGRLGGLPAMAQTLPTVERFMQQLPVPPPEPLLAGLSTVSEFAATLPSLAGYREPGSARGAATFPAQLEPPSEPTDILAPPGGMPGQIAGLSGAAAVLTPERQPPSPPQIVPVASAPSTAVPPPPAPPVQRATQPAAELPRARAAVPTVPPIGEPAAPAVVQAGIQPAPARPLPMGPLTQVLSPEQTLTGNVLPVPILAPVEREVIQRAVEEWAEPPELAHAAAEPGQPGERVTPAQRKAIESQRGQGQPLLPETRQRFEQAYGQPLDDVRVHTGPSAQAAAQSLNATAFASGPDLFFTQNTYAPDSSQGLSLIGHELAHVIQQQYGVSGDADALRPPDDRYEREADQLAARALDAPLAAPVPSAEPGRRSAAIQRETEDDLRWPARSPTLPAQPLAGPLVGTGKLPEDGPVQRFTAANARSAATPGQIVAVPSLTLPSLDRSALRPGSPTEQLVSPAAMLSRTPSLSQNLPGLGSVQAAGQALPVFRVIRRGLPGLGSVPDLTHSLPDLGSSSLPGVASLTGELPEAPSLPQTLPGLGSGAPAMPDLGGLAQGLGGAELPALGGQPASLPSLGGLTPPAMPLAEGLGQAADQAEGGALAAGQQALGSITSIAPSGAEAPAAPPLPSLDKLTEHIWKEVQRKLKVERERSRGLA